MHGVLQHGRNTLASSSSQYNTVPVLSEAKPDTLYLSCLAVICVVILSSPLVIWLFLLYRIVISRIFTLLYVVVGAS